MTGRIHPLFRVTQYLLLAVGAAVVLVPLIWMISTSLKPINEVFTIPVQWVPNPPLWENYPVALAQRNFARYFYNSVVVSVLVTALNLLLASLAAYGIAKYEFRGKRVVFILILSVMMLPVEVRVVPQFLLIRAFGWLDTLTALIVPNAVTALAVFIMHQFFITVPNELIESARMDGASEIRGFFGIVLPNSAPAMSSLVILTFLMIWNDYFWPLVAISTDANRTLPLGIAMFNDVYQAQYHHLMAVSILVTLPVVVVFLLMQRRFIEGVLMTGIKG